MTNTTETHYDGLGSVIDTVINDGMDWCAGAGWFVKRTDAGGIVIEKYDAATTEYTDDGKPVDTRVVADIPPGDIDLREWDEDA